MRFPLPRNRTPRQYISLASGILDLNPFRGYEGGLRALIVLGAALRIAQYLYDRTLWIDECFLALNVIHRPMAKLFAPLDLNQAAPPGFVAALQVACGLAGRSSLALRFLPLLGGVASLLIFKRVAQECLDRYAVPIALAMFALSDHLIYYASEAKQYSTDVMGTLLCYYFYSWINDRPDSRARALISGILGGLITWFSHPVVFAQFGVVAALFYRAWDKRRTARGATGPLLIVVACWATSFALFYQFSLRPLASNDYLHGYWNYAYMPLPPRTLNDWMWFKWTLTDLLDLAFEPPEALPAIVAMMLGCLVMAKRKPDWFIALALPGLGALAASAIHKYPFSGRLVLFLVPCILILVSESVSLFRNFRMYAVICLLFSLLTLQNELINDVYYVVYPRARSELRPLIAHLEERLRPGDVVYLSWYANFADEVYGVDRQSDASRRVVAPAFEGTRKSYLRPLEDLYGERRVWVLWGGVADWREKDVLPEYRRERKFLLDTLDSVGRRIEFVEAKGAILILYDLGHGQSG